MKDTKCPYCKADLDEIIITDNYEMTPALFEEEKDGFAQDFEDKSIYYEHHKAKVEC